MKHLFITGLLTVLIASSAYGKTANSNDDELDRDVVRIHLFEPSYIIPFYSTQKPFRAIYNNQTPDNQRIQRGEFKARFGILIPVWTNIFGTNNSINFTYGQLMYWQVYATSQYFREINYQPQLFWQHTQNDHWQIKAGLSHQSNGRGGELERSWNRAFINQSYRTDDFYFSIKPWLLVFKRKSSDLHNADIGKFRGHAKWTVAYQWHKMNFSLSAQNNLESGFKRGTVQAAISYPMFKQFRVYLQAFSGYGQSLIEYNHYTSAFGLGLALSDWL